MTNALKAALLSGIGFPGLGQVYLKEYPRAAVVIIITIAGFGLIIYEAVQIGLVIMEQIASTGSVVSIGTIMDAAKQAAVSFLTMNLGFLLIIIGWIAGTIDAYKAGKRKDIEEPIRT